MWRRCHSWIMSTVQKHQNKIYWRDRMKVPKLFLNTSACLISLRSIPYFVRCEESNRRKFELPEPAEISPKQIVEQSCVSMSIAALQLLQLTTAAILNACASYKKAMEAEMLLLNRSLDFVNVEHLQEEFNDLLIEARAEIQQTHKDLQELLGFMEYVEKTASSTAETTFLGGAEYSSFTLSDVLFDAQKRVAEKKVELQSLETELRTLQQQIVLRTKEKKANKPVADEEGS